jgi:predicted alpha/beta-fold hydrolase
MVDGAMIRAEVVEVDKTRPTLVAVHGMGGSADSMYMLGLSHKAYLEGWNSVRLSLYNCNPELRQPKVFHAGCSGDLAEIVSRLTDQFEFSKILLVGVSMGGNTSLKLLGELGDRPAGLVAAATISPLADLHASWPILEARRNRLYRWYYVSRLRELALNRAKKLDFAIDTERLSKVRSIREFDEVFTAPLSGYRDVFEYYSDASARSWLSRIHIPTLIIHARDDPLLPWQPLVDPAATENPALILILTEKGGHAAFIEKSRADIDRSWAENRVIDFFRLVT